MDQIFSRVRIALFAGSGSKSLAPVSNLNFSHIMFCASFTVVLFFTGHLETVHAPVADTVAYFADLDAPVLDTVTYFGGNHRSRV